MAINTEFKTMLYELSSLQTQLRDSINKWLSAGHSLEQLATEANQMKYSTLGGNQGLIRRFLDKQVVLIGPKVLLCLKDIMHPDSGDAIFKIIAITQDKLKDRRIALCILELEALDVLFDLHDARDISKLNVEEFSAYFGVHKEIVYGAANCAAQKAIGLNDPRIRNEIFEILTTQSWGEVKDNQPAAVKSSDRMPKPKSSKKATGKGLRKQYQIRFVQLIDELTKIYGTRTKAFEAAGFPKTTAHNAYHHGGFPELMLERINKLEKILIPLREGEKAQVINSSKPETPTKEQSQPSPRRPSTGTIRTVNAIELSGKDALDGTHYVLTEDSFKSFQISCEASALTILGALVQHFAATRGMLNVVIQLKKAGALESDEIIRKLGPEVHAMYESIELFESEFPVGLAKIFDQQRQFRKGR